MIESFLLNSGPACRHYNRTFVEQGHERNDIEEDIYLRQLNLGSRDVCGS